jgi:hypothetical protein
MTDERRTLLRRIAMTLAWASALWGAALLLYPPEGYENSTQGWFFFLTPVVLVVGERITRGDPEEKDAAEPTPTGPEADDPSATPPSPPS